jgi:hypothetical protein
MGTSRTTTNEAGKQIRVSEINPDENELSGLEIKLIDRSIKKFRGTETLGLGSCLFRQTLGPAFACRVFGFIIFYLARIGFEVAGLYPCCFKEEQFIKRLDSN